MQSSLIPRVLSTFHKHRVRALLMGGQACILYGAAEFSRDIDFAVAVAPANLANLRSALRELEAEPVFFPALSVEALLRGHACHFRCHALEEVRIDVMSVMRNAAGFAALWKRRTSLRLPGNGSVAAVSLPDLVQIKKTQRDKDWLMLRRLVEADVERAPRQRPGFWLAECRTPALLLELVQRYPKQASKAAKGRPAVAAALRADAAAVARHLTREEARERAADRRYWAPLRKELEQAAASASVTS